MTSLLAHAAQQFAFDRSEALLQHRSLADVLRDACDAVEQDATPTLRPEPMQ